jgi:hypothetical protein
MKGYSVGETVSYKQLNIFGQWREGMITEIDTSKSLPITVIDMESREEIALRKNNLA